MDICFRQQKSKTYTNTYKPMRTAGIVILIIGLLITIYSGVTFVTKKKVLDVGSVQITKDERHNFNWSPYAGVGVMVVGAVIILAGRKKGSVV